MCVTVVTFGGAAFGGVTAPFLFYENPAVHGRPGGDLGRNVWGDRFVSPFTFAVGDSNNHSYASITYHQMGSIRRFSMDLDMSQGDADLNLALTLGGVALRSDIAGQVTRHHRASGYVSMITAPNGIFGSHPRANNYTFLQGQSGVYQVSQTVSQMSPGSAAIPAFDFWESRHYTLQQGRQMTRDNDPGSYRWIYGDFSTEGRPFFTPAFYTGVDQLNSVVWYGGSPNMVSRIHVDVEDSYQIDGAVAPLVSLVANLQTVNGFDVSANIPDGSGLWQVWYRLTGTRSAFDWSQSASETLISLGDLPPDDYTLQARVFDGLGAYGESSVSFSVPTPGPAILFGLSGMVVARRRRRA
jgi:hypothetical protein